MFSGKATGDAKSSARTPIALTTEMKKILSETEWQQLRSAWTKFAGGLDKPLSLEDKHLRAMIGSVVVSDDKQSLSEKLSDLTERLMEDMEKDSTNMLRKQVDDVVSFISGCFDVNMDGEVSWVEFATAVATLMRGEHCSVFVKHPFSMPVLLPIQVHLNRGLRPLS